MNDKGPDVQNEVRRLKEEISTLNESHIDIKKTITDLNRRINSLQNRLQISENKLKRNKKILDESSSEIKMLDGEVNELKISITEKAREIEELQGLLKINKINTDSNIKDIRQDTTKRFQNINRTISQQTIYWFIAAAFLAMLSAIVYLIMKNKIVASTDTLDNQIIKTRETFAEESIKLDSKLVELLETQFNVINQQSGAAESGNTEQDHTFPLKVGLEIHRMRKRISNMPEDTKGINALKNSLKRLKEQFNDNGYEMINLLGKPYLEGMTVDPRFIPSDELNPGEHIITKVIKPQINFNGVLIQISEVEVSTGD